ncbi:MAG: LptF/LptG family permease [Chlamydiales bacterium]|nr:LptF/LptG family permease [Chlamydiales bacterium]
MPTVWRFLLGQYLKVLFLCVISFIAILLTTRMDEIAQFAALGASSPYVIRFIVYQIPYILPIAIPIAALISTVILMQRLSGTYELTALRACGYSLAHVATPLLLMATLLSIGNFYIISEMATHSHLMKRVLKREIKALNPLILLQNEKLTRMKGIYAHAEGGLATGEEAKNLLVASYNARNKDLNLFLAKHLVSTSESLSADNITIISSLKSGEAAEYDRLLIENAAHITLPTPDLSQLMGNASLHPKDDYLKMSLLLMRGTQYRNLISNAKQEGIDSRDLRKLKKQLAAVDSEIVRRVSLAISVFTFTLMGIAFGMHLTPRQVQRGLTWVLILATGFLVCYFTAKGLHGHMGTAIALYLLPHAIIITLCCRALKHVSEGREA